jgi:hypothetical protein
MSTLGIAGVLLGQWRPGGTVRVRADGTVAAASPDIADTLDRTRLFTLPTHSAGTLLELLAAADPPAADREAALTQPANSSTDAQEPEPGGTDHPNPDSRPTTQQYTGWQQPRHRPAAQPRTQDTAQHTARRPSPCSRAPAHLSTTSPSNRTRGQQPQCRCG